MKSRAEELSQEIKDESGRRDLDPARAVVDPRQGFVELQREILAEMAGALSRAEDKVEAAIAKLAELEPGSEAWETQRRFALDARRDLVIHREALRFPHDPELLVRYPIPKSKSPKR